MILIDPALVRSAPELGSLEILTGVLEVTLVALTAAHPCLESGTPCCRPLAPCCLAEATHYRIDELYNAILNYRAVVEEELESEQNGQLPF